MPELPEVETIKNAVRNAIDGAVILKITVNNPRLRVTVPDDLPEKAKNAVFTNIYRIAKYIVMDTDKGISLIIHLGMSGKIKLSDSRPELQKHDHVVLETSKGFMVYNDVRRFGVFTYATTAKLSDFCLLKKTGIDPFHRDFDGEWLYRHLKNRSQEIKQALLNQKIIAGIGNIYASEALFSAGIMPTRAASSLKKQECHALAQSIRQTLEKAILAGGSTLKDYQKPDGSLGYFQHMHCVYNKTGQRCPDCTCNPAQTGGIKKIVQNGRSTYFCPTKQK